MQFFSKLLFRINNKFGVLHQKLLNKFLNRRCEVNHNNITMCFFVPNALNKYRVKTFASKEPETLTWIEGFSENSVFWDIGANIGLYSIYAAKCNHLQVCAFEPSVFNLELLAKNIHNNNLSEKIKIFPLALSDHSGFNLFKMNNPVWGGALSTLVESNDQQGKFSDTTLKYIFPG